MGKIIDLEDYRAQRELEELNRLREELDAKMQDLTPILPEPYFISSGGEDYLFLDEPAAGSLDLFGGCPSCGYNTTAWTTMYTKDNEDES